MPSPPFTIGYFDDGEHRAGTGRYLTEIIGALDRTRFTPVFFAPEYRHWHEDLTVLEVETVYLEGSTSGQPSLQSLIETEKNQARRKPSLPPSVAWWLGLYRETKRLRTLFRKRDVDLLHTNNTGAEPAPIAAKRAGVPRVLGTFHVLPSYDLKGERSGANFRWLERKSMAALDRAIGCCEAATRDWQNRTGFQEGLAVTIHNGIDLNRVQRTQTKSEAKAKLGYQNEEILIGAVGNLHLYKGHTYLLDAFVEVQRQVPEAKLLIAGTGPEEETLKAQAQRLGIGNKIQCLGFCPEVRGVLEALDIFVQASLVEAFPIAILEASGIGLPVVATSVGGVPEAIVEGKTGLLVPPQDTKSLSDALTMLAQNAPLRDQMGEAGRALVCSRFTREKMVSETMMVYEEMLSR